MTMLFIGYFVATNNWPWPSQCPPIPWDKKQEEEYNRQQRQQVPEAPL